MTDTTTPPLLANRDALLGVLAAHVLYGDPDNGDGDYECGCGAKPPADAWEEDFGEERWHRAHLAGALAGVVRDPATLADAWEEGYEAGASDTVARSAPPGPNGPIDPTVNPYPAAALTEDPS